MKNKKFYIIFLITLIYLLFSFYFYINFSDNIESNNTNSYQQLTSIENILIEIHKQDSILYKSLLITDYNKLENDINKNNETKTSDFLKEIIKINELTNNNYEKSITNFLKLQNLREEIISLHQLKLISTQTNLLENKIQEKLNQYENLVKETILEFNYNNQLAKEENFNFKENIKKKILNNIIILNLLYLSLLILIIFNNKINFDKSKKNIHNDEILDLEIKNILNFLKEEKLNNNLVTIKDIKNKMKLTHPTILLKLKTLEKKELIEIEKKGRNKFIFIK